MSGNVSEREAAEPLSVSEFLGRVNELLETQVALVEGEIVDYRISQNKFVHFDLKDDSALVHCFGLAFRLRTPLEDGLRVRVWGVPRVYPKYGKLSLVVETVEPSGEGALRRAFELLRAKLEREGLFDAARKRALPRFPERIALVTSPEAAAYGDFLKVLGGRRGGLDILVLPVAVQGDASADAIAREVRAGIMRLDREDGRFALAVRWRHGPAYAALRELCAGIADGTRGLLPDGWPLVVVLDADIAGIVGQILRDELGVGAPVLCVDQIALSDLDFIDIGAVVPEREGVPVSPALEVGAMIEVPSAAMTCDSASPAHTALRARCFEIFLRIR
jgi:hypothetical protein